MFKALLAASVAMLACCAAAALAGPVAPAADPHDGPVAERFPSPYTLDVIAPASPEPEFISVASPIDVVGFVPTVSLVSAAAAAPASEILPAMAEPAPQPAVIPLPVPLYATILLLALALTARRMILRAC